MPRVPLFGARPWDEIFGSYECGALGPKGKGCQSKTDKAGIIA
jgi:hypothetical protein